MIRHNEDSIKYCLQLCCWCLFALLLLGGCIAYITFGIIFLIQDYGIANDCKNSNLWEYVLVAIVLSTCNIKIETFNNDINVNCFIFLIGTINLFLSIWGGLELWYRSCDELSDSNLWKIGLVSCIFQIIASILCLVVRPIIINCISSYNDNNELQSKETIKKPLYINTNV